MLRDVPSAFVIVEAWAHVVVTAHQCTTVSIRHRRQLVNALGQPDRNYASNAKEDPTEVLENCVP
eukprot:2386822-Pyramimonas_sp.AAC.1